MAEPASAPVLLEETDEWMMHRNSNGVVLRQLKNQAVGPEGLCITTKVKTEKEARASLDRFGWKSNA